MHGFRSLSILDSKTALIEVGVGSEVTNDSEEVADYIKLFEQLQGYTVRDEEALELIRRAQDFFNTKP